MTKFWRCPPMIDLTEEFWSWTTGFFPEVKWTDMDNALLEVRPTPTPKNNAKVHPPSMNFIENKTKNKKDLGETKIFIIIDLFCNKVGALGKWYYWYHVCLHFFKIKNVIKFNVSRSELYNYFLLNIWSQGRKVQFFMLLMYKH